MYETTLIAVVIFLAIVGVAFLIMSRVDQVSSDHGWRVSPDDPGIDIIVNGIQHRVRAARISYMGAIALSGMTGKDFKPGATAIVKWRDATGIGYLYPGQSLAIRAGLTLTVKES